MKHLLKYDKFNEGWFSDKLKRAPNQLKNIYDSFFKGITDIINNISDLKDEIKGNTKEGHKLIKDEIINNIQSSLDKSLSKFKDIKNSEDIKRIYSDFILGLSQVRSALTQNKKGEEEVKESLINEDFESDVADIIDVIKQNMIEAEEDFDKEIDDQETLDDKIKSAESLLKSTFKKSTDEIKTLDLSKELEEEIEEDNKEKIEEKMKHLKTFESHKKTSYDDVSRFLHKSYKDNPTDDDAELAERALINRDFSDVDEETLEDWSFDISNEILGGNFY